MSSIHYFQRYSQPENVATNNTLLLLSRLYQQSPNKFTGFLNDLLDDTDLEAGILFNQQIKGKKSIPDASITQISLKVIVETKLHKNFPLGQLTSHLENFGFEEFQILLSLSPKLPDTSLREKINKIILEFNTTHNTRIKYLSTTFHEIVTKFNNCLDDHDYTLIETIDDFEAYCVHDHLITDDESRMRVVPCGWTLDENFQFNTYYDPADRGYSDHTYLGIYSDKAVQGIGKIENIIQADLLQNGQLNIIESIGPVSSQQQLNIVGIIASAKLKHNWEIASDHKFFCVEKFYQTDFRKVTKYPIQGTKFFNLKNRLQIDSLPSTEEIAKLLRQIEW